MPITRRLPKRGFTNIFRRRFAVVNLGAVQKALDAGKLDSKKPVDTAALMASGLVSHPAMACGCWRKARSKIRSISSWQVPRQVRLKP